MMIIKIIVLVRSILETKLLPLYGISCENRIWKRMNFGDLCRQLAQNLIINSSDILVENCVLCYNVLLLLVSVKQKFH